MANKKRWLKILLAFLFVGSIIFAEVLNPSPLAEPIVVKDHNFPFWIPFWFGVEVLLMYIIIFKEEIKGIKLNTLARVFLYVLALLIFFTGATYTAKVEYLFVGENNSILTKPQPIIIYNVWVGAFKVILFIITFMFGLPALVLRIAYDYFYKPTEKLFKEVQKLEKKK